MGLTPLQHRRKPTGEQVETEQKRRERLLAMPKIVLHLVTFGLEHMGMFVGDLPPSAARVRYLRHRLSRHRMMGDTALRLQWFARLAMAHRDVALLHHQGVVPVS